MSTILNNAIAAIDLGSNAMRACIAINIPTGLEVIKNIRVPLRLGEDVFSTGLISDKKINATETAFIHLLELFNEYNVTQIVAKATSAMRQAQNRTELVDRVYKSTGIVIEMISGQEEARMVFSAVHGQFNMKEKTALIMDIGGGSTEIIAVRNELILGMDSFDIGTVRLLQFTDQLELERSIDAEVQKMLQFIAKHLGSNKPDLFIGTGGNLRRIGKIRKKFLGQSTSQFALFPEIAHIEELIFSMTLSERIKKLDLDQNKADVILPALALTKTLMKDLKLDKIQLPKVGLKEGILLSMLEAPPINFILKD